MSPSNQFIFPIYLGKNEHKRHSRFKRTIQKNIFRVAAFTLALPLLGFAGYMLYQNPTIVTSLNWAAIFLTFFVLFIAAIITGLVIIRIMRVRELMATPTPINVRSMPVKKLVAQKRVKQPVEFKSVVIDAEMWTKERNLTRENGQYQIGYLPEEFSADDVLVFSLQYDV